MTMQEQFSRTQLLIGKESMELLAAARVAVFGVGGVGGYAVEALARSGVGTIDLVDNDKICTTNLNRQIIAVHSTIGRYKVDVAKERIMDINPQAVVHAYRTFYLPETAAQFDFSEYDYVVDAIDTVTGKLQLAEQAMKAKTPIISCMGAGNKMDPTAFEIADISQTSVCPLAKVMRRELKKRGIDHLKVVYSKEKPISRIEEVKIFDEKETCLHEETQGGGRRKQVPGSNAFVPSVVGLIIAGEVVKDLIHFGEHTKKYEEKNGRNHNNGTSG